MPPRRPIEKEKQGTHKPNGHQNVLGDGLEEIICATAVCAIDDMWETNVPGTAIHAPKRKRMPC